MVKNGVLEDKFNTYYKDVNVLDYRTIFNEVVSNYRGKNFSKVLDIGSGIGIFLDSIKPFGYDLYALEASTTGLKELKKKDINALEFFLDKDNELPFEDNTFSAVVFNQVIEHVSKEVGQYYIKEIIRVLEPGGVGVIKSPSYYSRIWRTDPHHIYCWRPNELLHEVQKYEKKLENIQLQRVVLEPWMLFKYDENLIDTWHKYNKYSRIKRLFSICSKIIDIFLNKINKSDRLLAVSNVTFVKKVK